MQVFPLQNDLIDEVIEFANCDLKQKSQVRPLFSGSWTPRRVPDIDECRRIQDEVRQWLSQIQRNEWPGAIMAMLGWGPKTVEDDIRLVGAFGYHEELKDGKLKQQVTWNWSVPKASLRAICGLGVASILEAEVQERVGLCAREGCGTYFIDRKSRGVRREYCLRDECNKERNKDRTKRSRARPAKKARRKR